MKHDPNIGRIINGEFEIVSRAGEGGFGAVYVARQQLGTHTRKVALKLGLPGSATSPKVVKRFLREARALDALQSRHVCRVYGAGYLDDGAVFIAMEYVDGETLRALIAERAPLEPPRVARIAAQILEVLAEAHGLDEPILHRDLKPANVMIRLEAGGREQVFLLDFGIAKVVHAEGAEDSWATTEGMMVGSPGYTAPERLRGEEDGRADLYSLGVLMFEMLVGRNPFKRRLPTASLLAHAQEPLPEDMDEHGVPAGMQAIVRRALAKHPEDRFSSAEEMLGAVRAWDQAPADVDTQALTLEALPVAEVGAALSGASGAPVFARRRAWIALFVGVLLAGGWWALRQEGAELAGAVDGGRHSPATVARPPAAPSSPAPRSVASARPAPAAPRSQPMSASMKAAVPAPAPETQPASEAAPRSAPPRRPSAGSAPAPRPRSRPPRAGPRRPRKVSAPTAPVTEPEPEIVLPP